MHFGFLFFWGYSQWSLVGSPWDNRMLSWSITLWKQYMEETMRRAWISPPLYPLCILFSCTVRMALVKSTDLLEPELLKHSLLAVLGFHGWAAFSLGAASGGSSLVVVLRLLTVALLLFLSPSSRVLGPQWLQPMGSMVAACGLHHELNSCGAPTKLIHSKLDLPRSEIKPMIPALADWFFTIEQPKKPLPKPSAWHFNFSVFRCGLMPKIDYCAPTGETTQDEEHRSPWGSEHLG